MEKPLLTAGVLCAAVYSAHAENMMVPFNADVGNFCTIVVVSSGAMTADAERKRLASHNPGGRPGKADVKTTGPGFSFRLGSAADWVETPTGESIDVGWSSRYEFSGATAGESQIGALPTNLEPGVTHVTMDLSANIRAGAFPEGAYTAEVPVICE